MGEKKTLLDWFEAAPRELLYTVVAIALIIPLVHPLGLPVPVQPEMQSWYDIIDSLPEGANVLYAICSLSSYPAFESVQVATLHHLFIKNAHVFIYGVDATTLVTYQQTIQSINPESYGKEYGVDYMFTGYVPGGETAMKSVGENFKAAVPADNSGTPLDQIPMCENIHDATDFDLLICITSAGETATGWIRQWVTPYGTKYINCVLDMMLPSIQPYVPQQVKALIGSAMGGQYEFLLGRPGPGLKQQDAFTGGHLVLMAFIIMGNVAAIARRMGSNRR